MSASEEKEREMGRKGGKWGEREGNGEKGREMGRKGGKWGEREGNGEKGREMGRKGGEWGERKVHQNSYLSQKHPQSLHTHTVAGHGGGGVNC